MSRKDSTEEETGVPKILFFDIETAPNLSYVWAQYEQNVLRHEREWYMLCFSYQWQHEGKTYVVAQDDFPQYKNAPFDDSQVIDKLWHLFDEADVIIGHNIDKFDIRKANARFLQLGYGPPSPYQTVDTLKIARRRFAFNSNRLGDLVEFLSIGKKGDTGGFDLWVGCIQQDPKAWKKMKKYAKQDTELLPSVYERFRSWHLTHPTISILGDKPDNCPICNASNSLQKRGWRHTKSARYRQFYCRVCGGWPRSRTAEKEVKPNVVS